jgi:hypothetical protein
LKKRSKKLLHIALALQLTREVTVLIVMRRKV